MNRCLTILVTGSTGQLGQTIRSIRSDYLDYEFVFIGRQQMDLSSQNSISRFFESNTIDIVINCAAYTAVDKAESEPELADNVNNIAVRQLAIMAKKHNIKLIHISTDYVFSGKHDRPYIETDEVAPESIYGKTKLQGEQAIQNTLKSGAVIIRTGWVYSEYGNNFLKTVLKLGQTHDSLNFICDQTGSPTYAKDLAIAIMDIIQSQVFSRADFKTDLVHYSNEGVCSWYDFAKTILRLRNLQCQIRPIETKNYPMLASRPYYSVLDKAKIKRLYDLEIPHWKYSVERCLIALQDKI